MRRTVILSSIMTVALLAAYAARPVASVAEPISPSDIAAPGATPAATTAQSPEVTEALNKFKSRDFEGAAKLLKEAAKKNPDMPPAWVIMAQLFLQTNMGQNVRNALERAIVETPNDPEAYAFLGEIAIRERRIAEARLLYDKASGLMAGFKGSAKRKDNLQPRIHAGLATTDEAREDWAAAQKELEAWLKLDSKSTAALLELAKCLFQQKDVDGAFKKVKEAKQLDKEVLTPEATIAQYYWQAGDQPNAKTWFVAALTAAPRDLNTRLVAAEWAFQTLQMEEAKRQAAAALQLDAKSLRAKLLCGVVALFQKDYPAAELYFESANRQMPNEFAASNNLALALAEQKDPAKRDRALQYAEVNVRQYPDVRQNQRSAEAYSTYGWVLYKLGRLDDAEKMLRQATAGNFTAETAYYLARIIADRGGRDADARSLLEGALRTTAPFAQKDDAKELLDKLTKAEKPAKAADKPEK
jgi:tetratricopeptide (TPR) repeat protein